MSVINRIEVANLLNKHGDVSSPWDAKMRHLILDLRGQSSAVSMENGFGKTTLAEALIGLLSRDRTLLSRTRRKCSPSSVEGRGRSWSHLRVEFRSRSEQGGQEDLLASAGEEVSGTTFVFGFYGYSDGSGLSFYHYAGRFEDVPVHHLTQDAKLALYSNADVKQAMGRHGVRLTHNRDEWLDAVNAHVSRRELAQLAAFQKEGGADKSQIFNAIKPRGGEKPDQAFFFEVLAPEILAGATRGETDEGEELIEEVILNSGTNITELRHRLEDAETDQRRTEAKVVCLDEVRALGISLIEERASLARLDDGLMLSERLLAGQVLAGLPGIPRFPDGSAGEGRDSKNVVDSKDVVGLAWVRGDTGRPRVSVWLLARLSRQSERQVREALSELGVRLDAHRQLVHLADAEWPASREPHHLAFDAARAWLDDSHAFSDDAARYRAIKRLDEAAEAFESLDGNVFRDEVVADGLYRNELKSDIQALEARIESMDQERESLASRQREFVDNQSFYTQALAEGLFSEAELNAPEATLEAAQQEQQQVRDALSRHLGRIGEYRRLDADYRAFCTANPNVEPAQLLAEKSERLEALDERQAELHEQVQQSRESLESARQQHEGLISERARLEGELAPLREGQSAWEAYQQAWPETPVEGLWASRQAALSKLEAEVERLENRQQTAGQLRKRLVPLAESAESYQQVHGDDEPVHLRDRLYAQARELDDERHRLQRQEEQCRQLHVALMAFRQQHDGSPEDWLAEARAGYPRLLGEREVLEQRIAARESYLETLAGDPLARQVAESEAQRRLEAEGIVFAPLHQVLAELADNEACRRDWLIQAAGQLFAPVVVEDQADMAARCMIEHGLNVPVLSRERLATCLAQGQPPLGAICGAETLAVKAALNPEYLVELRSETQARLAQEQEERKRLDADIARFDPHGEAFLQALAARQAVAEDVEGELERIDVRLAELDASAAQLAPRISEAALQLIDDFQRYLTEGGDKALQEASETLAEVDIELAALTPRLQQAREEFSTHADAWLAAEAFKAAGGVERLASIDHRLLELGEREAAAAQQRATATEQWELLNRESEAISGQRQAVFDDGEREHLATLERYVETGGPDFMATAEDVQAELESTLQLAQRRASLDAKRIRAYLDVRDEKGAGTMLASRIARLKKERDELNAERRSKGTELVNVERRLDVQRQALNLCDELAIAWLTTLRELSSGWRERLQGVDGRGCSWPADHPDVDALDQALEQWWQLASGQHQDDGEDGAHELRLEGLSQSASQLQDGLTRLGLGERARVRERQTKEVQALEQRLGSALEEAASSRLFNETERARLGVISGPQYNSGLQRDSRLQNNGAGNAAIEQLTALHAQLASQLGTHRERVAHLQTSRQHIEGTLVERLGSIISDAAGNLDILKRVARKGSEHSREGDTPSGAWFEVKAALIDSDALRELITTLLADIDEHQAAMKRRAERDGIALEEGERLRRDDDLLGRIRRRIYRGLFKDVAIRLRHPAIRPHGRLFSLNEAMSEGQREAVSLMWLVKLSEFAIERELHELPGQRRRARAMRESVILLDGLFSKLSHRRLIQDSLESLRNTRGRFQMIGLIHNPNYENDPEIFPTYLVGSVIGGGQGGHVMVRDGKAMAPEEQGRSVGEASLFGIHVTAAEVT
uniref:hypothetical protein n=1 Tax=Halomonas sp. TaxID=1486246 RepID=UPI00261D40DB|nr:hypothetical protein [Halomonas sp.]